MLAQQRGPFGRKRLGEIEDAPQVLALAGVRSRLRGRPLERSPRKGGLFRGDRGARVQERILRSPLVGQELREDRGGFRARRAIARRQAPERALTRRIAEERVAGRNSSEVASRLWLSASSPRSAARQPARTAAAGASSSLSGISDTGSVRQLGAPAGDQT
jgi:hypothetical protein